MAHTLHLVIPGLLGPWPKRRQAEFPKLALPALERVLSRAAVLEEQQYGLEATLFNLFGVTADPDQDLPVAAVTRLADGGAPDDAWWLRADPVHLRADLHQAILFDARLLQLHPDEAADLVADCNDLLQREGWHLEGLRPNRWYLRTGRAQPARIRTTPLPEVIGQDIQPRLPHGPDKERWHALLTELQMLLHQSDVNGEREWDNQLPVNSVWFWGGGALPAAVRSPAEHVYGRDPLTRGLCTCAAQPCQAIPDHAHAWRRAAPAGHHLVVLETVRYYIANDDLFRWCDRLQRLEQDWFAPCLQLFRRGQLDSLVLSPCDGRRFHIERADLRRFWRSTQPLARHLSSGGVP